MIKTDTNRQSPRGGYSIRAAAAELNFPEKRVRRAVDLKEIEVVDFGGVKRIPPRVVEQLRDRFK